MSLYADYVRERLGDEIIEKEYGFATYRFLDEKTVYIVDVYVAPSHRASGYASAIGGEIVGVAKKRGCTRLVGTVAVKSKDPTASIQVLIGYGMKLLSASPDGLVFEKDI